MSEYGTTPLARAMVDDRPALDRKLDMADEQWNLTKRDAYFCLDDPQLSPMQKAIIEQLANLRYGKRSAR